MGKAPTIFESAFDTYTVQGSIGNGGCGTVFSVKNSANEELALKCLSPNVTSTKKRKRFKNEIDFCLKQRHPNIIQVIDYGIATWDKVSVPFYVMAQYTSTLAKLIKTSLSAQQVLPLFSDILDGVEAAHKLGVTHRDLKPENILYDESKNLLVIADFGIADFAEQLMATMVETKPGERMANFHYAAPEQCRQGASVDWRADIYALGAILNEMFTQHVPRGQGYSTIGSISQEYRYLDSLVEQMLQTDPNARPQSIEAIKKDLIGHKNEFIRLQELDARKREVVPSHTQKIVEAVIPISVDWQGGKLTLQLNRAPDRGWINTFTSPSRQHSWTQGIAPHNFNFMGSAVGIGVNEDFAQTAIESFKKFSQMATESYQLKLQEDAARLEAEQRLQLRRDIEEREKRQRVIANLRL